MTRKDKGAFRRFILRIKRITLDISGGEIAVLRAELDTWKAVMQEHVEWLAFANAGQVQVVESP